MKRRYALRVSVGYAVAAALWILLSDTAMLILGFDPASGTAVSVLKGLLFVGVTTLVLYLLVARFSEGIESSANTVFMSETRYRDLVESVSDVVWEADGDCGLTFVNSRASVVLGRDADALLGMTPMDLAPDDDREALGEFFARLKDATPPYELLKSRVVRPDGSLVIVESNVLPVHDSAGVFLGYRGVTRDVTERENLLSALQESSEFLSALIRGAPVPIVALDENGIVTVWNPAAAAVFGWTAKETVGRPDPIINVGAEGGLFVGSMPGKPGDAPHPVEVARLAKDGREVRVKLFMAPLVSASGSHGGVMAMMQDVTEDHRVHAELMRYREHLQDLVDERTEELRRANDDLREATDAKSAFLANMSHELRTPLNAIIGFTGILMNGLAGPVNEEQYKQLEMAHNAGSHLLELINDVLDLSKIEANRTDIHPEPVLVSEIVRDVSDTIALLADKKGLAWVVDVQDPDLMLFTDARRVEQVLLNLLGNAVKFTDAGEVSLRVAMHGDSLRFSVVDTGPGIPPERQVDIFDEFIQMSARDGTLVEGTGLGLPIARRLAGLLGGAIGVRSDVGAGSTFVFDVPIHVEEGVKHLVAESVAPVLVVGDDPELVERCEFVLHPMGYRVVWTRTVSEALAALVARRPVLAIVDGSVGLPGGGDLGRRIATDDQGPRIPVVRVGTPTDDDGSIAMIERSSDVEHVTVAIRAALALIGPTEGEAS